MSQFSNMVLTTQGSALQTKAQAGTTELKFTRVAIGDGYLPEGGKLENLTALVEEKQSLTINLISIDNGLATLRVTFTNSGLTTGYYVREFGVFASDPDEGEILYSVANAGGMADYLPPEGANLVEQIFDVVTVVGNAADVSATIDPSLTFVTLQEFTAHHHVTNGQNDGAPVNAVDVVNAPSGNISKTNVQDAINQLQILVNAVIPPGSIFPYAAPTAPDGFLLCYGQAVPRTTYSNLFALIGTTYGKGDGSTTFNLPDLRGRTLIGLDSMGGISANIVINAKADILGGTGGEENHTLIVDEMPSHTHVFMCRGYGSGYNSDSCIGIDNGTYPLTHNGIQPKGGSEEHNNMQPWIACNYIMKY
jgi:microcystin-dependent protein